MNEINYSNIVSTPKFNPKDFPIGSVVYYTKILSSGEKIVDYGIVEENYPDTICLKKLDFVERRFVDITENGKTKTIYYPDFETPTKWKKLPKGWTYDTRLYEMNDDLEFIENNVICKNGKTFHENAEIFYNEFKIAYHRCLDKPEQILRLYELGILVDCSEIDYSNIEVEIDSKLGYSLCKKTDGKYHPSDISIDFRKAFKTYEEAQKDIDDYKAELHRQSELSDYDWSVEQIDKTLNRWQKIYDKTDLEKEKVREFLLSRDNVEDIEIKISYGGGIEWKYEKNKKYMDIEV